MNCHASSNRYPLQYRLIFILVVVSTQTRGGLGYSICQNCSGKSWPFRHIDSGHLVLCNRQRMSTLPKVSLSSHGNAKAIKIQTITPLLFAIRYPLQHRLISILVVVSNWTWVGVSTSIEHKLDIYGRIAILSKTALHQMLMPSKAAPIFSASTLLSSLTNQTRWPHFSKCANVWQSLCPLLYIFICSARFVD